MTDQLPATQNSTPTKQILSGLSGGLKALLGVEPSNRIAVSEIANNPVMLAEARAALPALKAHAVTPATQEEIRDIIGAKFATFRQPQRTEAEWSAFWADHYAVLDGITASALTAAMDALLLDPDAEFLPKPAKIRERALSTPNRSVRAYDRARQATELADEKAREIVNPVSLPGFSLPKSEKAPADKAAVQAQLREYLAADDERKRVERENRAEIAFKPPATDEAGITPAMRKFLEERGW